MDCRRDNSSRFGLSVGMRQLPPNTDLTAWYLPETISNRYEPSQTSPPQFLTDQQIYIETEVIFGWVDLGETDADNHKEIEAKLNAVRNMPIVDHVGADIATEKNEKAFDEKADKFWAHHIHPGETMRSTTQGSGYVDIQDMNKRWIRRPVERGNFWILPNGCYHRYCLDSNKSSKVAMSHYDKKGREYHLFPEADKEDIYIHYVERMKCLRRARLFDYNAIPGSVDVTGGLNRP